MFVFLIKKNKVFRTNNSRNVCTYCNKNGHTIDTYYKKHRYPPSYMFYSSRTNQVNNIVLSNEVFSKKCQQGRDNGDIFLPDLFNQNNNNNS